MRRIWKLRVFGAIPKTRRLASHHQVFQVTTVYCHQRGPLEHTFLDPFGGSFSAVSNPKFASIYIFSFAQFQISVIFQDFCTIFARFDAILLIFKGDGRFCNFLSNFRRFFFGISQNFSDFGRSDAKIAIFQRNVKKLLKFRCKFCENLSEKMYALNPSGNRQRWPPSSLPAGPRGGGPKLPSDSGVAFRSSKVRVGGGSCRPTRCCLYLGRFFLKSRLQRETRVFLHIAKKTLQTSS